jgi:hypothetical protein
MLVAVVITVLAVILVGRRRATATVRSRRIAGGKSSSRKAENDNLGKHLDISQDADDWIRLYLL